MATTSPSTKEPASLLTVPPELRNKIYHYALISPSKIRITPSHTQPALLRTCRKLRKEAIGIYYCANHFIIPIHDCDATIRTRWFVHLVTVNAACQLHFRGIKIENLFSGGPNWGNLLRWCRGIQARETTPAQRVERGCGAVVKVCYGALELAGLFCGREWEECEKALRAYRSGVGALEPAWLLD